MEGGCADSLLLVMGDWLLLWAGLHRSRQEGRRGTVHEQGRGDTLGRVGRVGLVAGRPAPFGTHSQAILLPCPALGWEQPGSPRPSGPDTSLLLVQLVCGKASLLPQKKCVRFHLPLTCL